MTDESTCLYHGPCAACGSSDACAVYDDGHTYCFSCEAYTHGEVEGNKEERKKMPTDLLEVTPQAFNKRKLTLPTCRKYGYGTANYQGQKVQVANYHDAEGNLCAQKIRLPNKEFISRGDMKSATLFGQNLWRSTGGRRIIITEGEIDCLSVAEVFDSKWPVVSVPNGATSAKKALKRNLEFLQAYETVVLMFDMDAPGQKAAKECARLFRPGQAKIAHLSAKDPNELLVAGRGAEIISASWEAKEYRPDGIVAGEDLWKKVVERPVTPAVPYPHSGLQEMLLGIRQGEILTICAGSGVGKTNFVRELAYHLIEEKQKVGYVALEESVSLTALGLLSLAVGRPLRFEDDVEKIKELQPEFERFSKRLVLYDHFGSMEVDNLLDKIRYMIVSEGCTYVILDHISIVVSGIDEGDERKLIDVIMTRLRSLVEETGAGLLVVSHLKRPKGTPHEEGGVTSLAQLRGSAGVGQLSDSAIGLERNQQDEDNPDLTKLRVLKSRWKGQTGVAGHMQYDHGTGRMIECAAPDEFEAAFGKGEKNEDY